VGLGQEGLRRQADPAEIVGHYRVIGVCFIAD
jgi:hypothetical protein